MWNLGAVEGYRPGPEHYGDDKVLPGLPWGRVLRQGKPGNSLTAPFIFLYAEAPLPGLERSGGQAVGLKL